MKIFLRVLGVVGLIGGGLVSGGVIPAGFGAIFAAATAVAGAFHPSVQSMVAFGKDAK